MERNPSCSLHNGIQRPNATNVIPPARQNAPMYPDMASLHLMQLTFEIDLVYYSFFYAQMNLFFFRCQGLSATKSSKSGKSYISVSESSRNLCFIHFITCCCHCVFIYSSVWAAVAFFLVFWCGGRGMLLKLLMFSTSAFFFSLISRYIVSMK